MQGAITGTNKDVASLHDFQARSVALSSHILDLYRWAICSNREVNEAEHSLPPCVEIKNAWSRVSCCSFLSRRRAVLNCTVCSSEYLLSNDRIMNLKEYERNCLWLSLKYLKLSYPVLRIFK